MKWRIMQGSDRRFYIQYRYWWTLWTNIDGYTYSALINARDMLYTHIHNMEFSRKLPKEIERIVR